MIPKSLPSDLIRGWHRFSDKIMRNSKGIKAAFRLKARVLNPKAVAEGRPKGRVWRLFAFSVTMLCGSILFIDERNKSSLYPLDSRVNSKVYICGHPALAQPAEASH